MPKTITSSSNAEKSVVQKRFEPMKTSEDPLREVYEKNDESLKQLFSVSQQIHMVKNLLNDLQNERNKLIIEAAENGIRPVSIARVAEMNDSWVGTIIKRVSHPQEIVGGQ